MIPDKRTHERMRLADRLDVEADRQARLMTRHTGRGRRDRGRVCVAASLRRSRLLLVRHAVATRVARAGIVPYCNGWIAAGGRVLVLRD